MILRRQSLGASVLLAMITVGIIAATAFSLVLYKTITESERTELQNISAAAIRSVASLASRAVDGGNIMKLKNKDAVALYQAAGLQYLKIKGMSQGTDKTVFSAARPPQEINYEYSMDGIDKLDIALIKQTLARHGDLESNLIDEQNWLYVLRQPLPDVKNGAELIAVFSAQSLKGSAWRTLKQVSLVLLLVGLITLFTALLCGRLISRPVVAISGQIKAISDSLDLSRRVEVTTRNEIGETAIAFNTLIEKTQQLIGKVELSTEQLTDSVAQIGQATQEADRRSQAQETETAQVAKAMSQMTAVAEGVADNAASAAQSATNADEESTAGQREVATTVSMIGSLAHEIELSSQAVEHLASEVDDIGSVLEVIRGIAEQTNLLALNAAIEAARAGDSGRGFAVVADEVRTLAGKTQQSTEEIQKMIERLQSGAKAASAAMEQGQVQVEAAVSQADLAGKSLDAITDSVSAITEMNSQIATSVAEQTGMTEEINQNMIRFNELSNEAATEARSTVDASRQLSAVADHLKMLIQQFKV